MEVIKVEGGLKLGGTVRVEGAKNSALKLMAATMMAPGVYRLGNVPDISDVHIMGKVLKTLGATIDVVSKHDLVIDTTKAESWTTPYELVTKMRASITILGPLITRFGRATVAMPGGCAIGSRSIEQHLKGLEALGVRISNEHGNIHADARHGLVGTIITLPFASVGATENILMASVKARGTTVIDNAAREPEIVDLASMLNSMGAKISGAGQSQITIEGVEELHPCDHVTVGDRIEAGTFIVAGALTADELTVTGFDPMHLDFPLRKMEMMGIGIERHENSVTVHRVAHMRPADIQTLPFPGFPTDMQAQFMVLDLMAEGKSYITENIFENRFMLVSELLRMGADIHVEENHALIKGPSALTGAPVKAPDLRGGAALVLAGLIADGYTTVSEIRHIKRGYEDLCGKMNSIGASVKLETVPDPEEE